METELRAGRESLNIPSNPTILRPAGADLIYPGFHSSLPENIFQNPILIEQAEKRRTLISGFERVFEKMPDSTSQIEEVIRSGVIDSTEAANLFDSITDFLESEEDNRRLLLYLPFEMLPDLDSLDDLPENVIDSGQRLGEVLRDAWIVLLHEIEPRANFVDGDILEPGLREPEGISKAGHLTPELMAKGIITPKDACLLLESISSKELLRSLAQGITVANDRGLIPSYSWDRIRKVIDDRVGNPSSGIVSESYYYDPTSNRISPERVKWLRKVEEEKRDHLEGELISQKIIDGLSFEEITNLDKTRKIKILGIIDAGKKLALTDPEKARNLSRQVVSFMQKLMNLDDPLVEDTLISGLNQWVRCGLVDEEYLEQFGFELTDLSLPSFYSEEELLREFEDLVDAAKKVKEHPILSQALFPAFLVFGSKIKGYADEKADLDVALFFRPQAKFEDREDILSVVKSDIPQLRNLDKLLEFWTLFEDGKIVFREPEENTRTFVGETQIHFLMGGAWIGYGNDFMQMYQNMLERYLDLSRFGDQKNEIRTCLLDQLEHDVLQYRLMHKGYRKFYPLVQRPETQNSNLIDYESDFWDPGFRRVATKLFLSRVFLPDLS